MSRSSSPSPAFWGPEGRRAAVSITFDNLGEAADLERGLWPADKPLGHHFSVTRALPRILDTLDESGLKATFFVEGLNARLYPEALREISDRGHDLGYHGWRHESWANLSQSEEARLLERGVNEMEDVGVRPRGFRPPGGRLNSSSLSLLGTLGFAYCSPAGAGTGVLDGVVILPFDWRLLDAYYYLARFGDLRMSDTGSAEPLSPSHLGETIRATLESTVNESRHMSLLFHPFLTDQDDRFRVVRETLEELRKLVEGGEVWCAPHREVARWVREHHKEFEGGLDLDLTET